MGSGKRGRGRPPIATVEHAVYRTEIIDRAIDLGINFFDTANMYSLGESERILGNALERYDSDWPVVATKAYMEMSEGNPNTSGLSRKAIEQELANSLERLGMETVDLYQIHRWDYDTPIAETMRALDDDATYDDYRCYECDTIDALLGDIAHY